jgi:hypothetical protein
MSVLTGWLLAGPGLALGLQAPPWNGESWELFRGLYASERIDFAVPAGACEPAAERLAAALRAAGEFEASLDPAARSAGAVRLVAGPPGDPEVAALARAVGAEILEDGFRLLGREYRASGDALTAVFEDPLHRGRPLCLVLGNEPDELPAYFERVPRLSRPYLWIHGDGELALECPLTLRGAPRAKEVRDYAARRAQYFAGESVFTDGPLVLHARSAPDPVLGQRYLGTLARVHARVSAWFGAEQPLPVEVWVYEHAEDLEACLGTSALSVANRLRARVHALLAPGMPDDGGLALARVLARAYAGPAAEPWIEEAFAVAAAGEWWQRPLEDWTARLGRGGIVPGMEEIVAAPGARAWSEHVLAPFRGLYLRYLLRDPTPSSSAVRAHWKGAELKGPRSSVQYQRALATVIGSEAAKQAGRDARRARRKRGEGAPAPAVEEPAAGERKARARRLRPGRRQAADAATPPALAFRHGIALTGTGPAYSARAVGHALDEARAIVPPPDALSLTVFATREDPEPPLVALEARAVHGSASDLALASACAAARARDLGVLLQLEVLAQPRGAWADNIPWTEPDDPREFFERYETVALHYALLAELLAVEVFSFGAHLRESTRTESPERERDPALLEMRRLGWKRVVQRMRAAYSGPLAFCARFPEARDVGFIEGLDLIGLSLFPRVTREARAPTDDVLLRGLRNEVQAAIELGVLWNRPVLLLQLGFPARGDSWSLPMVPRGIPYPRAQQRFLAALADVLEGKLHNAGTLAGFYLWNWPVAPSSADAAGFSLRAPELQAVLGRLFAR